MTGLFFDTGVALKLVVEEPLSPVVRQFVATRRVPVLLTSLIEVEMETALHTLLFRREISGEQLAGARSLIAALVRKGLFRRVDLSMDKIVAETLSLVPVVTPKTGCRTLDLMHVAAAKLLGTAEFISTDKRQIEAAKVCGFQTISLGVPPAV